MKYFVTVVITLLICFLFNGCKTEKIELESEGYHTWSNYIITKEPTCLLDGEQYRKCTGCGLIKYKTISRLGHDYIYDVTEATCISNGLKQTTCSRCDFYEEEKLAINPNNHNYSTTVITPPHLSNYRKSNKHMLSL